MCYHKLVISFAEITRVEKRMTAKIIPNGILIATNTSTVSSSQVDRSIVRHNSFFNIAYICFSSIS